MAPLRVDEKWLTENPDVAEKIREALEQQTQEPQVLIDAKEQYEAQSDTGYTTIESPKDTESDRTYIPIVLNSDQSPSPKRPFWHYAAVIAVAVFLWQACLYITNPNRLAAARNQQPVIVAQEGQTSPQVAAMQQDLNRVIGSTLTTDGDFGPSTLSALQSYEQRYSLPETQDLDQGTWQSLKQAATTSQPNQSQSHSQAAPQQSAQQATVATTTPIVQSAQQNITSPVITSAPAQQPQPAQSTNSMTVGQWDVDHGVSQSLSGGTSRNTYISEVPLPNGQTWTAKGPWEYAEEQLQAVAALPVSAFENGSSPPITGQMSGNDLPITLEVSGPDGTKVIQGKIDSGAVTTTFPESFLQSLGYSPMSTQEVMGVTGSSSEGVYDIPYIQVKGNSGQWETLYPGTLQVWGDQFNEALVGADVLQKASLSVNGTTFILALPN